MKKIVTKKQSLLSRLKANGQKLLSFDNFSLSLFGSFITGNLNADSDFDLLTDFDKNQIGDDNFLDLSSSNDIIGDISSAINPD
jgi:predicted nucleotidyltransferase